MRAEAAQSAFRPRHPLHMVWLATEACNARCLHCSTDASVRRPDELDTAEACRMVEDIAHAGVMDLAVSGGEPLLRRDLIEILQHAREQGLSVGVGTNGAAFTGRRAKLLAEAGVGRVQVSLDGFHQAHDQLRTWPGLFHRAVRALQVAREAGLRAHVCCTVNRTNWRHLGQFADFVAGLGVQRLNVSRYVPTGRATPGLDLAPEEWRTVVEECLRLREHHAGAMEVVSHLAQQILVEPELESVPGFAGCQAGRGQGCIGADGTVYPCVLLPVPLGNVLDRPFRSIWTSSPVIAALQDRNRLDGRCSACEVRDQCGGCRAVAYATSGDYLATDPRCWRHRREACVTFHNQPREVNRGNKQNGWR